MSPDRLKPFDTAGVIIRYENYRADGADRRQVRTRDADEFARRFLLHVLPKTRLLAGATRKVHLNVPASRSAPPRS